MEIGHNRDGACNVYRATANHTITIRLPRELHGDLVALAALEGVSVCGLAKGLFERAIHRHREDIDHMKTLLAKERSFEPRPFIETAY